MRLIDETDIATRAAVAARLAPHACAPRSIMLQLARDVLEVAEPVLLHSPCLTPADCAAIIAERGVVLCRHPGPARQADGSPDAGTCAGASAGTQPLPRQSCRQRRRQAAAATGHRKAHATKPPSTTMRRPPTKAPPHELCELFFAAGSAERRLILLNLDLRDLAGGRAAGAAAARRCLAAGDRGAAAQHGSA